MSDWNPQVDREFAEQDGLTEADFHWEQWPVSNVRLVLPEFRNGYFAAYYRCNIPSSTPQANQYDKNDHPIPDPVGIALSRVQFQLIDADAHTILDEEDSDHQQGAVESYLNNGSSHGPALWRKLVPGGDPIGVKLRATPMFYYLTADGAAHAEYAKTNNGYFSGRMVESSPCTMALDENGVFLLNGRPAPEQTG